MAEKSGGNPGRSEGKVRRLKWDNDNMKAAMEAVSSGEMTVSASSRVFKVPRKTLDDRIRGNVSHGKKPGRTTILTPEEEESLTQYLLYMAERGFPLTRTMVKAFAWAIAKRSGNDARFSPEQGPSEHWWQLYRKRHPNIVLRKSDSLERTRAEAFNEVIVTEYFEILRNTLTTNNLTTSPRQIYNCDETFLPMNYTREKVVAAKGAKNVYSLTTGASDHISLLCCVSAAGLPLPPMIIYSKSFPGGPYRFDGPDDALYAKSDSGWIDTELFLSWLKKIFLKHVVSQRPVLLLVDGHKSHINLDVIDLCRQNDVILFCLPPHTTHALQPLDVSVFKSLKDRYAKAVRSLSFTKKNFIVTKRDFSKVLKVPFEQAFSIPNIKAGFTKCGIFPLNPDAIAKSKMTPSSLYGGSCCVTSPSSSAESDSSQYPSSSSTPPPTLTASVISTPVSGAPVSSRRHRLDDSDQSTPPSTPSPSTPPLQLLPLQLLAVHWHLLLLLEARLLLIQRTIPQTGHVAGEQCLHATIETAMTIVTRMMVQSIRYVSPMNLELWQQVSCFGLTATSVDAGCTTSVHLATILPAVDISAPSALTSNRAAYSLFLCVYCMLMLPS